MRRDPDVSHPAPTNPANVSGRVSRGVTVKRRSRLTLGRRWFERYGAEQDLRGADDRNRTRVFSLGSCFATFDHGGWMIDGRIGDHSICGAFPGMRCGWRKRSAWNVADVARSRGTGCDERFSLRTQMGTFSLLTAIADHCRKSMEECRSAASFRSFPSPAHVSHIP